MADVANRDAKEAALSKVLAKEFNRARLQLLGLIPELDAWMYDVAPEFWDEHANILGAVLVPELAGTYMAQAETMLEDFDFLGVDWGLVNADAVEWATSYSYNLVEDVVSTSRKTLQKLIPSYFDSQWTQGKLSEMLTPTFGTVRAEMIARTEVTRAASEAEVTVANYLQGSGIEMEPVWNTRNDELVCPICWPLNGMVGQWEGNGRPIWTHPSMGTYEPPPAHPRCRCWWGQQFKESEA